MQFANLCLLFVVHILYIQFFFQIKCVECEGFKNTKSITYQLSDNEIGATTVGKYLKTPKALPINYLTTKIFATVGKYLKTPKALPINYLTTRIGATTVGKYLKTPKALPINYLTTRIGATVGKYLKTH